MHSEILSVQIYVDVVFVLMLNMHNFTEAKLNIFLVFIPENGSMHVSYWLRFYTYL